LRNVNLDVLRFGGSTFAPFQDADNPISDLELAVLQYFSKQAERDDEIPKVRFLQNIYNIIVPRDKILHINSLKETIYDIVSK